MGNLRWASSARLASLASLASLAFSALACIWAWPALAQSARPDPAEAAAAMERAQRLAANPMRVILQAGKIRRKSVGAEAAPEPADAANLRRTAAVTSVAATPTVTTTTTATATAATTAAAAGTAAPAAATRAAPVEAAPSISTALVFQASQLMPPAANAVASLENTAAPEALSAAVPKMVAPQTLLAPLPSVQPTLVSTVEPDIPARLLRDTGGVNEVLADLSLRADGTVAEVQLISPYPRSWRSYLVAALEQWRFEPLASARVHRIQLVFGP